MLTGPEACPEVVPEMDGSLISFILTRPFSIGSMGLVYIWVRVARSWPPPHPPPWYGPPPYPAPYPIVLAATVVVLVLVLPITSTT